MDLLKCKAKTFTLEEGGPVRLLNLCAPAEPQLRMKSIALLGTGSEFFFQLRGNIQLPTVQKGKRKLVRHSDGPGASSSKRL